MFPLFKEQNFLPKSVFILFQNINQFIIYYQLNKKENIDNFFLFVYKKKKKKNLPDIVKILFIKTSPTR